MLLKSFIYFRNEESLCGKGVDVHRPCHPSQSTHLCVWAVSACPAMILPLPPLKCCRLQITFFTEQLFVSISLSLHIHLWALQDSKAGTLVSSTQFSHFPLVTEDTKPDCSTPCGYGGKDGVAARLRSCLTKLVLSLLGRLFLMWASSPKNSSHLLCPSLLWGRARLFYIAASPLKELNMTLKSLWRTKPAMEEHLQSSIYRRNLTHCK